MSPGGSVAGSPQSEGEQVLAGEGSTSMSRHCCSGTPGASLPGPGPAPALASFRTPPGAFLRLWTGVYTASGLNTILLKPIPVTPQHPAQAAAMLPHPPACELPEDRHLSQPICNPQS